MNLQHPHGREDADQPLMLPVDLQREGCLRRSKGGAYYPRAWLTMHLRVAPAGRIAWAPPGTESIRKHCQKLAAVRQHNTPNSSAPSPQAGKRASPARVLFEALHAVRVQPRSDASSASTRSSGTPRPIAPQPASETYETPDR